MPTHDQPATPGTRETGRDSGRRRRGEADAPLGSLTQPQHRSRGGCRTCGSERVTRLAMTLTDGTPVDFVSCHRCEARVWEHDGTVLGIDSVIDRTRKVA